MGIVKLKITAYIIILFTLSGILISLIVVYNKNEKNEKNENLVNSTINLKNNSNLKPKIPPGTLIFEIDTNLRNSNANLEEDDYIFNKTKNGTDYFDHRIKIIHKLNKKFIPSKFKNVENDILESGDCGKKIITADQDKNTQILYKTTDLKNRNNGTIHKTGESPRNIFKNTDLNTIDASEIKKRKIYTKKIKRRNANQSESSSSTLDFNFNNVPLQNRKKKSNRLKNKKCVTTNDNKFAFNNNFKKIYSYSSDYNESEPKTQKQKIKKPDDQTFINNDTLQSDRIQISNFNQSIEKFHKGIQKN